MFVSCPFQTEVPKHNGQQACHRQACTEIIRHLFLFCLSAFSPPADAYQSLSRLERDQQSGRTARRLPGPNCWSKSIRSSPKCAVQHRLVWRTKSICCGTRIDGERLEISWHWMSFLSHVASTRHTSITH